MMVKKDNDKIMVIVIKQRWLCDGYNYNKK